MSSSTPWITDSKYDPIWHYSEFARWVVENRELIKDKMIDENNMREQGNRGISYLRPQIDEIIVLQIKSKTLTEEDFSTHYYWFNYNDSSEGSQYLISDEQIDDFIRTYSDDYTKIKRRVMKPNLIWKEGGMYRMDRGFYRIKFKDIRKRTPLINWNEIPWGDVK